MISSPDIVKSVAQRDVNAVRITTVDVIPITTNVAADSKEYVVIKN